jgi:hypothetical protein
MPKFGRLWAIDFCNQFFLRRTPRDDDRLFTLPALEAIRFVRRDEEKQSSEPHQPQYHHSDCLMRTGQHSSA